MSRMVTMTISGCEEKPISILEQAEVEGFFDWLKKKKITYILVSPLNTCRAKQTRGQGPGDSTGRTSSRLDIEFSIHDVNCITQPFCAICSVYPTLAMVFLSEFPSRRRSADQGWRASSAPGFISQPCLGLEVVTRLLTARWSRRRTSGRFPLGMTVPPVNPPRLGRTIVIWSATAYSTRQAWLISQLTSIS